MNELALFAGAGGGILGGVLNGWKTVCAVEIDPYCQRVLMRRQDDGILEPFPIWPDVRTFDGRPWAGCVDIVTGGFPCQDISSAGKGAGITGGRSGLWKEMARIVGEVRPRYVFVENSPMLAVRGLGVVLADLAQMGFDAEWGVLGASDVGAPHIRKRIWIVALANADNNGCFASKGCGRSSESKQSKGRTKKSDCIIEFKGGDSFSCVPENVAHAQRATGDERFEPAMQRGRQGEAKQAWMGSGIGDSRRDIDWWKTERGLGRVANGVANRVDRLKAIGNGQVPAVVRLAWSLLSQAYGGT